MTWLGYNKTNKTKVYSIDDYQELEINVCFGFVLIVKAGGCLENHGSFGNSVIVFLDSKNCIS